MRALRHPIYVSRAALGAEVVLVDQCPDAVPGQVSGADLARVAEVCREMVEIRGAFRADQFQLAGSFTAHYEHTAPEIWDQAGGQVDAFVDYVGSGGTFAGCAAYFKEVSDGRVKCFVVEPAAAVVLDDSPVAGAGAGPQDGNHRIQGGGYSISLEDLPVLQQVRNGTLILGFFVVVDVFEHRRPRALETRFRPRASPPTVNKQTSKPCTAAPGALLDLRRRTSTALNAARAIRRWVQPFLSPPGM